MRRCRDAERLLPEIVKLAERAAAVILDHYRGDAAVRIKADASPVTAADEAAEAVILAGLAALTPDIPVVAEETVAAGRIPAAGRRPVLAGRPARRHQGVHQQERRVHGQHRADRGPRRRARRGSGAGAGQGLVGRARPRRHGARWRATGREPRRIAVRPRPAQPVAVASRSHADPQTEAFLDEAGVAERISAGSSLKFCLVAEGKADLYPRFGRTMEWDTAAGHAVLSAAGGRVTTRDGAPFVYRKPGFENPGFIARGD